jgi:hypothetical protein
MSLISKSSLSLTLQAIKKLLSFKADKSEVVLKDEVEEMDAVEIAAKMELVSPVAAEDGSIYTDENGALYSL